VRWLFAGLWGRTKHIKPCFNKVFSEFCGKKYMPSNILKPLTTPESIQGNFMQKIFDDSIVSGENHWLAKVGQNWKLSRFAPPKLTIVDLKCNFKEADGNFWKILSVTTPESMRRAYSQNIFVQFLSRTKLIGLQKLDNICVSEGFHGRFGKTQSLEIISSLDQKIFFFSNIHIWCYWSLYDQSWVVDIALNEFAKDSGLKQGTD